MSLQRVPCSCGHHTHLYVTEHVSRDLFFSSGQLDPRDDMGDFSTTGPQLFWFLTLTPVPVLGPVLIECSLCGMSMEKPRMWTLHAAL